MSQSDKYFNVRFKFFIEIHFMVTLKKQILKYFCVDISHLAKYLSQELIFKSMKLIICLMLLIALALADTCGGNCPGAKCPNCPCGTTKNMQDIGAWCGKYGWNQACCKCIVSHESGGNANAMNYNPNETFDVGLFQINHINWAGCNGGSAPCAAQANYNCAVYIYGRWGNSFKAWSTHTACGC